MQNVQIAIVITDHGDTIAEFEINCRADHTGKVVINADESDRIIETLRNLPSRSFYVLAKYPKISNEAFILNQQTLKLMPSEGLIYERRTVKPRFYGDSGRRKTDRKDDLCGSGTVVTTG
jgi:hypothetical protein